MSGWVPFLEAHRIQYKKSSGHNVEITCPLCVDDHSTNLGLSTKTSAWRCWRSSEHQGYSPIRVIQALLKLSYRDAKDVALQYFDWDSHEHTVHEEKVIEWVEKPEDFYQFNFKDDHEQFFIRYLKKRGLDPNYIINRFQLHYAITGKYHHRVIIPVIEDNHWYSWVARTFSKEETVRYLAADAKDVKSQPKNHLFDMDNLFGGKLLVITEGAFDAIAVTASMIAGVHGTALFGKQITDRQIGHLMQMAKRYQKIALGLDPDAYTDCQKLISQLQWYLPGIFPVYPTKKDWADMAPAEIKEYLSNA